MPDLKGKIAIEYIEQIGKDIDIAFFDISQVEPGEILNFLMVLTFLKGNDVESEEKNFYNLKIIY